MVIVCFGQRDDRDEAADFGYGFHAANCGWLARPSAGMVNRAESARRSESGRSMADNYERNVFRADYIPHLAPVRQLDGDDLVAERNHDGPDDGRVSYTQRRPAILSPNQIGRPNYVSHVESVAVIQSTIRLSPHEHMASDFGAAFGFSCP